MLVLAYLKTAVSKQKMYHSNTLFCPCRISPSLSSRETLQMTAAIARPPVELIGKLT
jgi:hypothetical protein